MYREFIDKFVLSPSMRQYLKTVDLSVEQITQLIYFSPVLLQQKKQAFYRLRDLAEKNQDEILKKECHRYISNMEEALSYLRVNGIISVESNIADEMMNEADSHFEGVFDTCNDQ